MENLVTFLLIAAGVAVGEIVFTLTTSVYLWSRRNQRKAEFQGLLDQFQEQFGNDKDEAAV